MEKCIFVGRLEDLGLIRHLNKSSIIMKSMEATVVFM